MSSTSLRRAVTGLRHRRLDVPARLLADAHRPLAPLLSDLGVALGPLLGAAGARGAGRLLAEERLLEAFVDELDADEEPDARAG
ncbi:MAG TPA: hypothetical protein VLA76_00515 [Candidatus Angelobacter sp.]|nr:hypothetical protein [Candidatus Angelobacter sp.]